MMEREVKIFFPVDVPSLRSGITLLNEVVDCIDVPKVGLELIHAIGTQAAVIMCQEYGKNPFVDAKLIDIPETVRGAAKSITKHGPAYFNMMACGGKPMMVAGVEGAAAMARELGIPKPKVIAVTVLTSMTPQDLVDIRVAPQDLLDMSADEQQDFITELVMAWAENAVAAGVDCLLSSPKEGAAMRAKWPSTELIFPGIRMPDSPKDDQARTMTPYEAVLAGANGLVIGRPIRKPPQGKTRAEMAQLIRADIDRALAELGQ